MAERFLTLYEAANRLDVSNQVIREWLRNGRLKGVKAGRLWMVNERDLEKFLEETRPLSGLEVTSKNEEAKEARPLREYTYQEIREFLKADRISPETARRLEWIVHVLAGVYKAQADVLVSLDKRHILTEKVRKSFPIPVKDTKRFLKDLADVISIQTKLI